MAQALKPGYDFCTGDSFDGRMPGLDRLAIAMLVGTGPSIRGITKDRYRDYLRTGCPVQQRKWGVSRLVSGQGWLRPVRFLESNRSRYRNPPFLVCQTTDRYTSSSGCSTAMGCIDAPSDSYPPAGHLALHDSLRTMASLNLPPKRGHSPSRHFVFNLFALPATLSFALLVAFHFTIGAPAAFGSATLVAGSLFPTPRREIQHPSHHARVSPKTLLCKLGFHELTLSAKSVRSPRSALLQSNCGEYNKRTANGATATT